MQQISIPVGESLAMASESLWHQHAALFRRLYIDENKTLKQVKSEAEGAHGFPSNRHVT
jgi:hypothetical protein